MHDVLYTSYFLILPLQVLIRHRFFVGISSNRAFYWLISTLRSTLRAISASLLFGQVGCHRLAITAWFLKLLILKLNKSVLNRMLIAFAATSNFSYLTLDRHGFAPFGKQCGKECLVFRVCTRTTQLLQIKLVEIASPPLMPITFEKITRFVFYFCFFIKFSLLV